MKKIGILIIILLLCIVNVETNLFAQEETSKTIENINGVSFSKDIIIEQGKYELKVKAKEENGIQSEWPNPSPISMPQPKANIKQRIIDWFNQIDQLVEKLKITGNEFTDNCGCGQDETNFPYTIISQQSLINENKLISIKEKQNTYPFDSTIKSSDFPSYFNWKDINGKDFTTKAKLQANCGSCWDFAGLGALEAVINIRENDSALNPDLSEQYVLSCLPDAANNYAEGCLGGQPVNAFRCIMSEADDGNYCNGIIWESCFDYEASHEIDCSEKCEDWLDYLVPISDYGSFWNQGVLQNTEQSQNNIKNALMQHGPVGSFMDVTDSFIRWGERNNNPSDYCPYEDRTFNNHLNHAILIIGWKDDPTITNGGYWICKNSWGEDWGYDGFYNIEYGTHFTGFRIDWVDYDPDSYDWEPYSKKPFKPTVQGPSRGKLETEQTYSAVTTDPNDEQLYYLFDWGDGSNSEWLGPFESGEPCENNHFWSEKGDYEVRVKAKNVNGLMSEFSEPIPVKMPYNYQLFSTFYSNVLTATSNSNTLSDIDLGFNPKVSNRGNSEIEIGLYGGFGINVDIINHAANTNIIWKIAVNGGLTNLNYTFDGNEILFRESTLSLKDKVRGFGKINVQVTVNSDEIGIVKENADFILFLMFSIKLD